MPAYLIIYYAEKPREFYIPGELAMDRHQNRIQDTFEDLTVATKFIEGFLEKEFPKPKWRHTQYEIFLDKHQPEQSVYLAVAAARGEAKQLTAGSETAPKHGKKQDRITKIFNTWWATISPRITKLIGAWGVLDTSNRCIMLVALFKQQAPSELKACRKLCKSDEELETSLITLAQKLFQEEAANAK